MALKEILELQIKWAGERPLKGHVLDHIEDNLYRPMHAATFADFARGSGDELGLGGQTAKLRSLRSSSALACNVFDAWRGRDLELLAETLGVMGAFEEMGFEQKMPHGLRNGTPPNLDVVLYPSEGMPLGIESKFLEIYDPPKKCEPIDTKYFANGVRRWEGAGLVGLQVLAERIGHDVSFKRLGAAQLLKHALGLAHTFRNHRPVRMMYLWYDAADSVAAEHHAEVKEFGEAVAGDIEFQARTYQDLFRALEKQPEPMPGYLDYLRQRYFAGEAW